MTGDTISRLAAALLAASSAGALAASEIAQVVRPETHALATKARAAVKPAVAVQPSPVLNEMVGTLGADGHVHIQCHDVANPEHAEFERERAARLRER